MIIIQRRNLLTSINQVRAALRIYKERASKIIIMIQGKLYTNKIRNRAIVLPTKLAKSKMKIFLITKSAWVQVLEKGKENIISSSSNLEVITDCLDTRAIQAIKTTRKRILHSNKKLECLVFMDPTKEDEVDHQSQRKRTKINLLKL